MGYSIKKGCGEYSKKYLLQDGAYSIDKRCGSRESFSVSCGGRESLWLRFR